MSTSIANPSRVYVTSEDRDPNQDPASFSVTLPSTIENASGFEIISFALPNVFYPFGEATRVLYVVIKSNANQYSFYAVNLGSDPLADADLPAIPPSAYAGGTVTNTGGRYYRVFPNGLQATLDPTQPFTAQTRIAITKRAFSSGTDIAAYLQALFRSVVAAEVVNQTGAPTVIGLAIFTGNVQPNTFWNFTYDGFGTTPSANGTFRLGIQFSAPNFQAGILPPIDAAGNIRPYNIGFRLGYTTLVDTSPVTNAPYNYSNEPINLLRTQDIYVTSSLVSAEALSSSGRRDILFKVPVTVPYGNILSYQATLSGTAQIKLANLIRDVEITLLDDDFNSLELPTNAIVSAELHFIFDNTPASQSSSLLR